MPIIPKAEKIEKTSVALRLPTDLVRRLDLYCTFVGHDRATVITGLLEYAFERDKEFAQHEATAREPAVRRERRPAAVAGGRADVVDAAV